MSASNVALIAFAGVIVIFSGFAAAASNAEQEAEAIFHEYMSPYCPELLLSDCGSSGAADLRDEIRLALARGVSADTIRRELEQTYGASLRASPRLAGWGLMAWLVPPILMGFAIISIGYWIAIQQSPVAQTTSVDADSLQKELPLDLLESLREELNRHL